MFRSFIYMNEEKMYAYKSILENKASSKTKSFSRTKRKTAGFSNAGLNIGVSDESTTVSELKGNLEFDYNKFEELLTQEEGESFFNFILNSEEYNLSSLPPMSLIQLRGYMEIPEKFDFFNVIEQFKPMLVNYISTDNTGTDEALKTLFCNAKADVPVIIDIGDDHTMISGKLNTDFLCEDYGSLEEYSEQEVIFLCKVEGFINKSLVTIYNPARDFIKLNRTVRRAANLEENDELQPIKVEGPVLKVEIIAIYK